MAEILVTGATGNVGHPIALQLAAQGHRVRALVRDPERARGILPVGVEAAAGDVTDAESVRAAVRGCAVVYHAAGLPEQWRRDAGDFVRVNVEGTRNVAEAALAAGVERFVYTSTIDVFAWRRGVPFDETVLAAEPKGTAYERSKQEADRLVVAMQGRGLPAVFVHPAAVYGPAPVLTGANALLADLARGRLPMLLPGGMPLVYSDDVAAGHILAAGAAAGARYILSDAYRTLSEMADAVAREVAGAKAPRVMPGAVAHVVSAAGEAMARVTGKPPLIPRGGLYFVESHAVPHASRARAELGWAATSFEAGLPLAIAHFRAQGWI